MRRKNITDLSEPLPITESARVYLGKVERDKGIRFVYCHQNQTRYLSKIVPLKKVGYREIKTEVNILTSVDNAIFPEIAAFFIDWQSEELIFYYENLEYNLKYLIKNQNSDDDKKGRFGFKINEEPFLSYLLKSLVNTCKILYSKFMLLNRNIRPVNIFLSKDWKKITLMNYFDCEMFFATKEYDWSRFCSSIKYLSPEFHRCFFGKDKESLTETKTEDFFIKDESFSLGLSLASCIDNQLWRKHKAKINNDSAVNEQFISLLIKNNIGRVGQHVADLLEFDSQKRLSFVKLYNILKPPSEEEVMHFYLSIINAALELNNK